MTYTRAWISSTFGQIRWDLTFTSRGLHRENLNVRHVKPKMDELKLTIGTDILGIFETF